MANVSAGDTFGESLSFLGVTASPIHASAEADCEILWLSTENLRRIPTSETDHLLSQRFVSMLATRTLNMNDRIQILSRPTLRGRLVTFFSQYVRRVGRSFAIPFDRADMAAYLGTDRSALSRELGRMQKEGLLRFRKNRFEILRAMDVEE